MDNEVPMCSKFCPDGLLASFCVSFCECSCAASRTWRNLVSREPVLILGISCGINESTDEDVVPLDMVLDVLFPFMVPPAPLIFFSPSFSFDIVEDNF